MQNLHSQENAAETKRVAELMAQLKAVQRENGLLTKSKDTLEKKLKSQRKDLKFQQQQSLEGASAKEEDEKALAKAVAKEVIKNNKRSRASDKLRDRAEKITKKQKKLPEKKVCSRTKTPCTG